MDLDRARRVLEVMAETVDELACELGVVMLIDASYDFLRVPGHADLPVGVAGVEESEQLRSAMLVEAFIGAGQQAPAAVEGVVLAAAMPARLVLHATAALIELLVRELDDMKWICDLDRVGEHRVEHGPVRAREIERGVRDVRQPLITACGEPPARFCAAATRDDIEQHTCAHIDDRRRPVLAAELAEPGEQGLIQPKCRRLTDPVRVVIDERLAVRPHRDVDRVPGTLQLAGKLVHSPAVLTDLAGHPPARTIRHR